MTRHAGKPWLAAMVFLASASVVLAQVIHKRTDLMAVGSLPDAGGFAMVSVRSGGGSTVRELSVSVRRLAPSTSYKLFADGVDSATFATDSNGGQRLAFSSSPKGGEQLLPAVLNPASLVMLEVKTLDGQIVLVGTFAP